MKNNIKRIACLFAAMLMLVFAMTACGGSKAKPKMESQTQSTASKGGNADDNQSIEVPSNIEITDEWKDFDPYKTMPASLKGSTVRFATWIDHTTTEAAKPISEMYEKIGLKYEWYSAPQGGYVNDLMVKIASGDVPDVFVSNESDGAFPVTLQLAAPINKVSSVNLDEPIWHKSMNDTATIDGNVYMVNCKNTPWTGSNMVFFNKHLFEENGFKTPAEYYEEGEWTWDNMLKCLRDIRALGDDYYGAFIEPYQVAGTLRSSFTIYDTATHRFKSGVNDNNLLTGLQWYSNAKAENLLGGTLDAFREGKCGIAVRGPFGLKGTGYFQNMDASHIGFTYLPVMNPGDTPVVTTIYRMYGICDGAKNPDAAGYFLRYFLDYQNYDLDNTFLHGRAGNFYYELTNTEAENKYLCFDDGIPALIGEKGSWSFFWQNATNTPAAQMRTAIDAMSNKVDQAVAAANQIIEEKVAKDNAKYK